MLRFGVICDFRNPAPWRIPWERLYAENLELIQEAERLGFDSAWISEHHFLDDGYCPSILPVAAAVAAATKRIRIGTAVLLLPLHNPIRIAEDGAVVDILSGGRFDLGVGVGYRAVEFSGLGVNKRRRGALLDEAIEVVRLAWTEKRFSFAGQCFTYENVSVTPKPLQQPHPPIWIGGRSQRGSHRGARLGYPFLLVGGPVQYRQLVDLYQEEGRPPDELRVASLRTVFIAGSRDEAWDIIGPAILYNHNERLRWHAEDTGEPYHPATDWAFLREQEGAGTLIGTPEECLAGMREFVATVPVEQIWFPLRIGGLDQQTAYRSLERFAREVMPAARYITPGAPKWGAVEAAHD